jgi:copper chaperone
MAAPEDVGPGSVTRIVVAGMTCGHCVASVTEELSEVPGVQSVDVVLETGEVTITSGGPLDPTAVEAAVAEAGYALA